MNKSLNKSPEKDEWKINYGNPQDNRFIHAFSQRKYVHAITSSLKTGERTVAYAVGRTYEEARENAERIIQAQPEYQETNKFPNGFVSWMETHHEVVKVITVEMNKDGSIVCDMYEEGGTGRIYELGEEWTDEFENKFKGKEWDGGYYDAIEEFLENKLK